MRTVGLRAPSPPFPILPLPTCMVALRTSPSSDLRTSKTLASFHSFRGASSWTMTMSSTCTFRLGACHFCLRAIPARYSFLHRHQNCSDRYCTRLHLFLLYRSSLTNLPGGGSGTEDFIVSRWFGVSGSRLVGSLMLSATRTAVYNGHSLVKECPEGSIV